MGNEEKKNQFTRQNEWIAKNRERQSVTLPLGTKDKIKRLTGESVNGFINRIIKEELERITTDKP